MITITETLRLCHENELLLLRCIFCENAVSMRPPLYERLCITLNGRRLASRGGKQLKLQPILILLWYFYYYILW